MCRDFCHFIMYNQDTPSPQLLSFDVEGNLSHLSTHWTFYLSFCSGGILFYNFIYLFILQGNDHFTLTFTSCLVTSPNIAPKSYLFINTCIINYYMTTSPWADGGGHDIFKEKNCREIIFFFLCISLVKKFCPPDSTLLQSKR